MPASTLDLLTVRPKFKWPTSFTAAAAAAAID